MARAKSVQRIVLLAQKNHEDSWTSARMITERKKCFSVMRQQQLTGGFSRTSTGSYLLSQSATSTLLKRSLGIFLLSAFLTSRFSVLAVRVGFKADPDSPANLQPPAERSSVTILENGELVEMRARTFRAVRQWCVAYQEQWQVYNNLCLNDELSADYRKAAAAGGEAIADYRDYPLQPAPGQNPETLPGSGGRAEIIAVDDRNTRTQAAKYVYGVVCTGVLNYACRKILETRVVKPDTDTVAVPTSAEVDELLAKFDQQTPEAASIQAKVAEQLQEAAAPATGEQQSPGGGTPGPETPTELVATVAPGATRLAKPPEESQTSDEVTPVSGEQREGVPAEREGPEASGTEEVPTDFFPGDFDEDAYALEYLGKPPAGAPSTASENQAAAGASPASSQ